MNQSMPFKENMKPYLPFHNLFKKEKFDSEIPCPITTQYFKKFPCTGAPYTSDNDSRYFYLLDAYGRN